MYQYRQFFKKRVLSCVFIIIGALVWVSQNKGIYNKSIQFSLYSKPSIKHDLLYPFLEQIVKKDSITTLFTPDDPVLMLLVHLINQEKKSLKIAIFTFTELSIANAIIDACERGVVVELVTDRTGIFDAYSKCDLVYNNGVKMYAYNPQWNGRKRANIMHHKFIIFEHTFEGVSLVWTGSFNFTKNAWQANQENIILIKRKEVIKRYEAVFECLKARSYLYKPCFIAQ